MLKRLNHFLDRLMAPELDWIQVEVTTRCQAACVYCPHTILSPGMRQTDMPLALFSRLLPFLEYTQMIYLQGWGEPLLHPALFDMIRMGKKLKKTVGFTTNGMGLDEQTIHAIIDAGVDILGVSLAGTSPGTHDRFRRGNDFRRLMQNLEALNRIKAARQSPKPDLHLAYLALQSNFHELDAVIPVARSLGASQVVASNLTLIFNTDLYFEALFHHPEKKAVYLEKYAEISRAAERAGLVFDWASPVPDESATDCGENVGRACVVTVEGDVVPCVLMDPVIGDRGGEGGGPPVVYRFGKEVFPLSGVSFGNIENETLPRIWHKKAYRRFRRCFDEGAMAMPPICRHCYKRLTAG